METQISRDQVRLLPRHIRAVGKQDRISLVLYTRGGDTNVPWPFVSYLREYCEHLTVIVPSCANSSGTLLALGADEIIMGPFSELSPIDPTVANGFNPADPTQPQQRIPIAVEDVLAYLEMTSENQATLEGGDRSFQILAESVHPLALGNVKRSINQIRQLAKKLIDTHPPEHSPEDLQRLITGLTTEFYTHGHSIGRKEGRTLGLPITDADDALESCMDAYYAELVADLELMAPWNAPKILNAAPPPVPPQPLVVPVRIERAYVETASTCDCFVTEGSVSHQTIPTPQGAQTAIAFEIQSEEWTFVA